MAEWNKLVELISFLFFECIIKCKNYQENNHHDSHINQ